MYEGTIQRGDLIVNSTTGRKVKVPRLVRMHADDMEVSRSSFMLSVYVALSVECWQMLVILLFGL
jgi:elongation factor G